jgi:hypothetical protein
MGIGGTRRIVMSASGSAQVNRDGYLPSITAFDLWHLFAIALEGGQENGGSRKQGHSQVSAPWSRIFKADGRSAGRQYSTDPGSYFTNF